jgi:hypothetical protein
MFPKKFIKKENTLKWGSSPLMNAFQVKKLQAPEGAWRKELF